MKKWITTWAQAHADMGVVCCRMKDYTARITVVSQVSGQRIRLRLSNQEGKRDAVVAGASLQLGSGAPALLTFRGKQKLRLKPGAGIYTDPIDLPVNSGDFLTVSLAFTGTATSGNMLPEAVRCSGKGNYTMTPNMPAVKQGLIMKLNGVNPVMPILSAIEVESVQEQEVLVCFGDSITQMSLWTTPLAEKLQHIGKPVAVINKGIAGNRLLAGPDREHPVMFGISGKDRFQKDVLSVAGATALLIALGVNDLNGAKNDQQAQAMAGELMDAYRLLAGKAREAGMKVYVATITPSADCQWYQPLAESVRQEVNQMLRSSNEFDGILDFDAAIRDPQDPTRVVEFCDSGDHIHPGTMGGKKMAETAYAFLMQKSEAYEIS